MSDHSLFCSQVQPEPPPRFPATDMMRLFAHHRKGLPDSLKTSHLTLGDLHNEFPTRPIYRNFLDARVAAPRLHR